VPSSTQENQRNRSWRAKSSSSQMQGKRKASAEEPSVSETHNDGAGCEKKEMSKLDVLEKEPEHDLFDSYIFWGNLE